VLLCVSQTLRHPLSHASDSRTGPLFEKLKRVFKLLLRVQEGDRQGLKAAFLEALGSTAEAMPFPKPIFDASSKPLAGGYGGGG
jgi:hypothetical protein